jgi:cell division transport system permease protein
MIAGLKYFVTEAAVSLWRGRRSSALSILTITIALFVLGLFLTLSANLDRLISRWSSAAEFSVYLRDEASPADRAAVERALRSDRLVAGIDQVSKDAALQRFRADFPELAPAAAGAPENPFPASFEVRLASSAADAAALSALAAHVSAMPGVADVRYDRRWLDRLATIGAFVRWAGLGLAAVLVLAAALTITNVVHLALFARRDEIEIMELVGAPMTFIRGPFVFEGIIQGGLGAALGLVLLWGCLEAARARLAGVAAGLVDAGSIEFLPAGTAVWIVLGGMVVGCLGGLVAARRLR